MSGTELTVIERAQVALRPAANEQQLITLAVQSKSITTITNPAGRQQCHSARMDLARARVAIQKVGKAAREDATAFSKAVIAEEKRLISLIEPEELRLEKLQQEWDDAREAEKQAKIAAEMKRVSDLQERVSILRGNRTLSAHSSSVLIADHIQDVEEIIVDDTFQEFREQAEQAKADGLAWLRDLHTAALAYETEQARIKAEREELACLRQEQARREAEERARLAEEERRAKEAREVEAAKERERLRLEREEQERLAAIERARIAEEERQAKIARDAEAARQAEQLRRQREEEAAEAAKRQAIIDAENARIRAEQEAARAQIEADAQAERDRLSAEARRIADERAELERQRAALKPTASDFEEAPSAEEIVAVLAAHYNVLPDTVIEWLTEADFNEVNVEEIAA